MISSLKRAYATLATAASPAADRFLIRNKMPDYRTERLRHWLASLFAIHNFDRLVALEVPWWSYRAVEEVEDFLSSRRQARVFEWGSGSSTAWLAQRSAEVITIEHDAQWFDFLKSKTSFENVAAQLIVPSGAEASDHAIFSNKPGSQGLDFSRYVGAIDTVEGEFDLIVIDGRARVACLNAAISRLKSDGIILFDNSDRRRYREAIKNCGLQSDHFSGLTPCLPYPDQTSLLSQQR